MNKSYKALALFSGGLDSQLAVCVLQEQGIYVEAITYKSPFFNIEKSQKAAKDLGIKHHIIDFSKEIVELVQNPPHGLGKAMNPCIDCHTQMIQKAGDLLKEWGFDFLVTGEVLAQRPMSQNKQSLGVVARCSNYEDLLLRPLSAALLPPTQPTREGWVDPAKLPAISGRGRTQQIKLAEKFGIKEYPAPAGGCLLTEENFGNKLKDLLDHEGPDAHNANVWLLPIGRHLRLSDTVKIIVGSDARENDLLEEKATENDFIIYCPDVPGPSVIAPANTNDEQIKMAASICARYAKTPADKPVTVQINQNETSYTLTTHPMNHDDILPLMVVH